VPARREEEESVYSLWQDMNRLFDDFFEDFDAAPLSRTSLGAFSPSINVTESDSDIQVTAELPGVDEEDIDVTITRDMLTIQGEKKEETEDEGKNYYRAERSYGSFRRTVSLPGEVVDTDQAEATYKNGLLTIILPKREESSKASKRIEVQAG
jgi:HSP20 family protein